MDGTTCESDGALLDFVMVESSGGHGVHSYGQYDVFRPVRRQIWVGADGSGTIREIAGPYSFFTPEGEARWEVAGRPTLRDGLSVDVFGPGELRGTASRLAAARNDPEATWSVVNARPVRSLHDVSELLGETIVPADLRRSVFEAASALPGVEIISALRDQLGRSGQGLAETESNGDRREVIFGEDYELLGYRLTLLDPEADYAPPGTVISWTGYLTRQWAEQMPDP